MGKDDKNVINNNIETLINNEILNNKTSLNKILLQSNLKYSTDYVKDSLNDLLNSFVTYDLSNLNRNLSESLNVQQATLKTQIGNLIKAFENEDLVLVLGAGVSAPFKLPNWNNLLESLLIKANYEQASDEVNKLATTMYSKLFLTNPLITARYIQDTYSTNKSMHFENEVRNILYKDIDRTINSPIMNQIVQLCVSPGKMPNLDSIITYNYDDILEKAIQSKTLDVPLKTIYSNGMNPQNGELAIYHVHGYLPESGTLTEKNRITLSEGIYHEQYLDIYSWSNIVQINKFIGKTCLFVGSSFTDPNLRRLMDIARAQKGNIGTKHYIIKLRVTSELIFERISNLIDSEGTSSHGLEVKMSDLIKNLTEMNLKLEERDAQSFGAEIIWVDDYEKDIPQVLKAIRQKKAIANFS